MLSHLLPQIPATDVPRWVLASPCVSEDPEVQKVVTLWAVGYESPESPLSLVGFWKDKGRAVPAVGREQLRGGRGSSRLSRLLVWSSIKWPRAWGATLEPFAAQRPAFQGASAGLAPGRGSPHPQASAL